MENINPKLTYAIKNSMRVAVDNYSIVVRKQTKFGQKKQSIKLNEYYSDYLYFIRLYVQ